MQVEIVPATAALLVEIEIWLKAENAAYHEASAKDAKEDPTIPS